MVFFSTCDTQNKYCNSAWSRMLSAVKAAHRPEHKEFTGMQWLTEEERPQGAARFLVRLQLESDARMQLNQSRRSVRSQKRTEDAGW